jgi:carbohydrate kinase (thermoresistant glucokinase family)
MGVAGSGKSTVGRFLARQLGWIFLDADDFHPANNIAKMTAGIALTDADRTPWLQSIRSEIERLQRTGQSAVIACSALKKTYRDILANNDPDIHFILLEGTYAELYERLAERKDHFMKPEMLKSQFETLEITGDLIAVKATDPLEKIASEVRGALRI